MLNCISTPTLLPGEPKRKRRQIASLSATYMPVPVNKGTNLCIIKYIHITRYLLITKILKMYPKI